MLTPLLGWLLFPTVANGVELPLYTYAAGDVNGDGFADVAIAADPWQAGIVQVFHGRPQGLPTAPDAALHPVPCFSDDGYGSTITSGDFDGDGFDDLAVAAVQHDTDTGLVYVFPGGPTGLQTTPSLSLVASDVGPDADFGASLASADVDGDGYDELVVGAPHFAHPDPARRGAVYTFSGSPTGLLPGSELVLRPVDLDEPIQFGAQVATGMDLDGDGHPDLAVKTQDGSRDIPRAFVYLGSEAGFDPDSEVSLPDYALPAVPSSFYSMTAARDADGDGYDEVVFGEYSHNSAWLYQGGASGISTSPTRLFATDGPYGPATHTGNPYDLQTAYSISLSSGDVNGDGFGDVVVGAIGELPDPMVGDAPGTVYVHLGGPTGLATASSTRVTPCAFPDPVDDDFGVRVAVVGDIDADGFDDIVVSGPDGHAGPAVLMGRATWPDELCAEPWNPDPPDQCCDDDTATSACRTPCEDTGHPPPATTDTAVPTDTAVATTDTGPPPDDEEEPVELPDSDEGRACGCATGTEPTSLLALVSLAVLLRRGRPQRHP